jgi:hypothetical protein|tara:strand:+ start:134 stop:916 length:783 start_codon:yes stop_codon:yes gene_type:complete
MAHVRFHKDVVRSLFQKQEIASLDELKEALQTPSTMTVFRRLKALGYHSSYSHRGRYYTLSDIPNFDALGLWSCQSVWFSQYGTLLDTARAFVEQAEPGFTAGELQSLLQVETKGALLTLYRGKQLHREQVNGIYVYFAFEKGRQRQQHLRRQDRAAAWVMDRSLSGEVLSQELKAAIILFFSLLDEKQRRLYAGLEAFKLGHGGDCQISEFLGINVHTVARGRRELFAGDVERDRVRKKGGGRKPVEKKRQRSSRKSPK